MRNSIAFHAEMIGDIMYLEQAPKKHNAKKFVQAVVKEVSRHVDRGLQQLETTKKKQSP
jgi:hypothetical protein